MMARVVRRVHNICRCPCLAQLLQLDSQVGGWLSLGTGSYSSVSFRTSSRIFHVDYNRSWLLQARWVIIRAETQPLLASSGILRQFKHNFYSCQHLHRESCGDNISKSEDCDIDEVVSEDRPYWEEFQDDYMLPSGGHQVFVLQPDFKTGKNWNHLTTADLQLSEACGLVESIPEWRVQDKSVVKVKHADKFLIWGKGNLSDIKEQISRCPGVTAVFVSVSMLSGAQLAAFQKAWQVPVYDRYSIVLQIFQVRARTKEARLQVALAEIPYVRSRVRGIHTNLDPQTRKQVLQDREAKLKHALARLEGQRNLLKKERQRRELATVAVVGYTNAGKTSLIKALTGEQDMKPRDQLFATLDVTVHGGRLPSLLSVLYVDTVGFISDIPTGLIASFRATLGDMLHADVVIHVQDVSHPDWAAQQQTVQRTLASLHLPQHLTDNLIEVNNKVDLLGDRREGSNKSGVTEKAAEERRVLQVSAVTGEGLEELQQQVEEAVIRSTNRLRKRLRIPLNGAHLSWLYKEATVVATSSSTDDSESLMVDVIITETAFAKFKQHFSGREKRKSAPSEQRQ